MCLKLDNSVQVDFSEAGIAIVYKYLLGNPESKYRSPYYWYVSQERLKPGDLVISDRPSKELLKDEAVFKQVEKGIHFFLDPIHAYYSLLDERKEGVVVAFEVHKNDLVGTGTFGRNRSAVFMKGIFLNQLPIYEVRHTEMPHRDEA